VPAPRPVPTARRILPTPDPLRLGWVEAEASGAGLTRLAFHDREPAGAERPENGAAEGHLARLAEEMAAYLGGSEAPFAVPVAAEGTPFQQEVWGALGSLGFGERTTYGDLAVRLGRPSATRAVAAAIGRNPVLVVVPCHRVVGAGGRLTGYAAGLPRKRTLLELERPATPLFTDPGGHRLLTLSPAESGAVAAALTALGVRFDEVGPEAAGCAGPEMAVLRFPPDVDAGAVRAAMAAAAGSAAGGGA